MNTIPIEQGRIIAEKLLEEALLRLEIAHERSVEVCNVIGLILHCG
jgi:hypothetical protein